MTSSPPLVRVGSQTPRVANYPPYPVSAADEVIDFAAHCGLHLDEWQRYVLTHGLGCQVDGSWCATRCSVWVPRQNGKGGIIEALELSWLFLFDEELVIHSAHQHRTAQRAYDRLERIIRRTPDIHRLVRAYRQANGEQGIELYDGRELQYTTRSRTAVRGFSAPKVVLDEAQELTSEQIAALVPTVSAMPNWQIWFLGTPPDDPSAWCYGLREDGERGAPRLAHFDWGADLDLADEADQARTHDPDLWYATNPTLGIRIQIETVQDEDTPSGLGEKFPQERLGVWKPRAARGAGVISEDLWAELTDRDAARPSEVAFAIDVSPDRQRAAIVMAGLRHDDLVQLAVVDHRAGTAWLAARAKVLAERWNPVCWAIDGKSPVAALIPTFAAVGISAPEDDEHPHRGHLAVLGATDAANAWALLVDAARERRLRHSDDVPLNVALAGAAVRPLVGGSAWARRGDADITPLVGATEALWALQTLRDTVAAETEPSAFWL